jgi:hypothetical protein
MRNLATSLMEMLEKDPEDQIYCIELMGPMDSPAVSAKGIEDYYQTLETNSRC